MLNKFVRLIRLILGCPEKLLMKEGNLSVISLSVVMTARLLIRWVPEVFLACGRNFRCWPKADTSSAVGRSHEFRAGHYKDLTETGNRARKVSGTQGRFLKIRVKFKTYFSRDQRSFLDPNTAQRSPLLVGVPKPCFFLLDLCSLTVTCSIGHVMFLKITWQTPL